jgi:hypothetical protein
MKREQEGGIRKRRRRKKEEKRRRREEGRRKRKKEEGRPSPRCARPSQREGVGLGTVFWVRVR